jgi:AAA family ATP:ADP antiporter
MQDTSRAGRVPAGSAPASAVPVRWIRRLVDVQRGEGVSLSLAALFHFLLLTAYYILRPIRSEVGAEYADNLHWQYTVTFIVMLALVPVYAIVVSRWPRRVFLPVVYVFFALNLVLFRVLFVALEGEALRMAEVAFYVWTSVFNLFAVSVFWSFMADVHDRDAARRLFGAIAAGGSLGAMVGPTITALAVEAAGRGNLFLVSAGVLVAAACVVRPLDRQARRAREARAGAAGAERSSVEIDSESAIRGGAIAGLLTVFRSPYLLAIAGYVALLTLGSTFLDFERSFFLRDAVVDRVDRTETFAWIETIVSVVTMLVQLLVVGRLMKWLGVGITLAALPVINIIGFAALGAGLMAGAAGMVFITIVVFEVAQRAGRYALAKPSRETLFTVVPREDKYKAKAFIDNVVYRGGDASSAWLFTFALSGVGMSLGAIALVALPAFAGGLALSWWLGAAGVKADRPRAKGRPIE